ncbi:hypothetical protein GOP47_0009493 [Adiantum capillus-veneris]|uniref:Uncharacterized protein n=1 Tax=Adiantum capillus-veneris TaxID=13818 RepID=A0A9D4UXW3_ADICA|nr:hypothetical protein GOP47_0009493 [Adiantum capillus-veneris]
MGSRSSSRHGPSSSALFTGPVRRWKKAWAPISSPPACSSSSSSKIFLYKWIPLSPGARDESCEETAIQNVRYLPVSIALQRKDAAKRALEDIEPTIQSSIDKLVDQDSLPGLLTEGPNSMEQGSVAVARQVVRDLNFSVGADMSMDMEMQGQKLHS